MINTARQVGAVLGTAVLVVLFGDDPGRPQFLAGWGFLAATGLAAAVAAVVLALRWTAGPKPHPHPGPVRVPGLPSAEPAD